MSFQYFLQKTFNPLTIFLCFLIPFIFLLFLHYFLMCLSCYSVSWHFNVLLITHYRFQRLLFFFHFTLFLSSFLSFLILIFFLHFIPSKKKNLMAQRCHLYECVYCCACLVGDYAGDIRCWVYNAYVLYMWNAGARVVSTWNIGIFKTL